MSLPLVFQCKEDEWYWNVLKIWADKYGSDGCTLVPDLWCKQACWEHDFHYRYGTTIFGVTISKSEADTRFRQVIQMFSPLSKVKLGFLSPTSWTYWRGVVRMGKGIWKNHRKTGLVAPTLDEIYDRMTNG